MDTVNVLKQLQALKGQGEEHFARSLVESLEKNVYPHLTPELKAELAKIKPEEIAQTIKKMFRFGG